MATSLVVGGSKGIGRAVAERLVALGDTVHVVSRSGDAPAGCASHVLDVTSADFASLMLPETLDGLVYAPGSILLRPFHRLAADDFRRDFEINVVSAARVIQHALPALGRSPGAAIVLYSTVAVAQGMRFHASVAAAKAAVEGLARSLAAELAPRIRVNVVAPSLTDTTLAGSLLATDEKRAAAKQRHPLQQYGSPAELAAATVFLLREATWMTGQVLHVDGGLSTVRML